MYVRSFDSDPSPGAKSRQKANFYIQSHISGFRMAVPIDSTRPWTNKNYFTYGMAKAPDMPDRSDHEEKWEF